MNNMLPDKTTGCHRTGFTKTCFECVTQHGCKLWVRATGRNKDNDAPIDMYGCADEFKALMEAQGVAQLSMKLDMIAKGLDHLRLEVQGQTIQPMLDNIVRINERLAEAERHGLAFDPTKLIGSN